MTRLIAGQIVPLKQNTDGTFPPNPNFVNFGSPHVHIVTANNDAYFLQNSTATQNNIDKVIFSSYWFKYLEIIQEATATLTFQQRNTNYVSGGKKSSGYFAAYKGSTITTLVSHNLGYTPAFSCFDDNLFINSTFFVQYNTSFRVFQVVSTSSTIQIKENYLVWKDQIPAITKTFNLQIFKVNVDGTDSYTPSSYGLYIDPTQVIFGQGKFNSDRNYLYRDFSGKPLIVNNGMWNETALWLPDGGGARLINRFGMDIDGSNSYFIQNYTYSPETQLIASRDTLQYNGRTVRFAKP